MKPYALDYTERMWSDWFAQKGLPPYTAKQVIQWIFQKEELNPLNFSNIPIPLRKELQESFSWNLLEVDTHLFSKDGSEKFLLKTADGELLEMVLMPYDNRCTLCISSQIGCRMGCTFCQTGKMGLSRNLSSGEILSQVLLANRSMRERGLTITISNIVFMGMGEPLDNYESVAEACRMLTSPQGIGLSKTRVTVSTSGLIPEIKRLGAEVPVMLEISLHSTDNDKRSKMMPINRKYELKELKEALLEYPAPKRQGITFQYVMIEGENDNIEDAKKLVSFLHGLKAKVNLIPINHFPGIEMKRSSVERIRIFQKYLSDRSIPAPVRYSRGQDISGGCGQLAAKRENELQMDPRILHRQRRKEKPLV